MSTVVHDPESLLSPSPLTLYYSTINLPLPQYVLPIHHLRCVQVLKYITAHTVTSVLEL